MPSPAIPVRVIELPCHDIRLELTEGGVGTITSSLFDGESGFDDGDIEYESACDGIESLVLAHACAGIDVTTPAYVAGLTTAIDAITARFL